MGRPACEAALPADMKQGLLSVGIGGRESRNGCLDVEKGECPTPRPRDAPISSHATLAPRGEQRGERGLPAQPEAWLPPLSDCSITKFLNRILGLEVYKQNALFQYFSDTFDHLIEMDKREGKYDMGILGEHGHRGTWVGVGEGLVGTVGIPGRHGPRGNTGHCG